MESRPFISLSRKAFFFWCTFVMALFAGFFFAGTLVGRGQIQVDLGQNELFKEITGLSEPQAPSADADAKGTVNQGAEEPPDFEFYNNLASKEPDKSMDVTIQPSSKLKTKKVVKKNLDIVKPDELEGVQKVAATEASNAATAVKQPRSLEEPVKTEPLAADKTKSDTASKMRKEPVDKAVPTPPAKPKTETAEKTKTEPVQTVKAEAADKEKTEAGQKAKPAAADKTKTAASAKDAKDKDKATAEASKEKSKKPEKTQPAEKKDTDAGKKFSLQVAALKSENDAADMVKKLNGLGFSAYTVKSGDSEVWYKVRVGSFKDRTEAEKTISKLKNKNFDAFIVAR